jgi:hypothetical protein
MLDIDYLPYGKIIRRVNEELGIRNEELGIRNEELGIEVFCRRQNELKFFRVLPAPLGGYRRSGGGGIPNS